MTRNRAIISLIIIALMLIGPYWLYVPVLVLATLTFPLYWEGILLGFVIDTFYGLGNYESLFMRFPVALGVTILILLMPLARKYLRLNA
jgi:hypothetical protein